MARKTLLFPDKIFQNIKNQSPYFHDQEKKKKPVMRKFLWESFKHLKNEAYNRRAFSVIINIASLI